MAMNMIQFQSGLSLREFLDRYGTEAKCRRALYRWRWPAGFRCPPPAEVVTVRAFAEAARRCTSAAGQHQTTLISGTLMASTKLPLTTWLLATYLLSSTKTNLAALELKRRLGVCMITNRRSVDALLLVTSVLFDYGIGARTARGTGSVLREDAGKRPLHQKDYVP
jgi:hypothetical protein